MDEIKPFTDRIARLQHELGEARQRAEAAEAEVGKLIAQVEFINRAYHRPECTSNVLGPFASCCVPPWVAADEGSRASKVSENDTFDARLQGARKEIVDP